jgi:hypothetical protein
VLRIAHSAAVGIDRIRFKVPRGVPQGCFVPVYLRIGSGRPSNVVSMAIEDSESSCQLSVVLPQPKTRFGLIGLSRAEVLYSDSSPLTTIERGFAAFFEPNPGDQNQNPLFLAPPEGTCTGLYGDSQSEIPSFTSLGSVHGRGLTAGHALSISGSGGVRVIPATPGQPGAYSVLLGLEEPGRVPSPALFLKNDPQYTVSAGGAEVGPFARQIAGTPSFEWTNRAELAIIERSKGATFQWRNVPPDARVLVLATGVNSVGAARGVCYCTAKTASGRLTIPPEMLANLPAGEPGPGPPVNVVYLIALRTATPVSVKGLDQLWEISIYATGRRVTYR